MTERILIVDDDEDVLALISRILIEYEVITASSGLEALARVDDIHPSLIILDVMMPGLDGFEVCRRLRRKASTARVPILMLTAQGTPEAIVKGFEAGADQYAHKPFSPVELKARVRALLQRAAQVTAAPSKPVAKIIAVFSLRGGVGTSMLASNLAAALASIWGGGTVLADMVMTAGHDALMLGLTPTRTWSDLATLGSEDIDISMIETVMLSHSSGLRVLAAPTHPEQSLQVTADKVTHVLNTLGRRYNYLVLDLPHDFYSVALAGLDVAQEVIVLMAPELASLLSMVATMEAFASLEYPADKVRVVLNRIFEPQNMGFENIEKAIKRPIDMEIPYTPDVFIPAIGKGTPAVLSPTSTPVGNLLEDYAFYLSKEQHKRQHPAKPTKAWLRVTQRIQKRHMVQSSSETVEGPAWLARIWK